MGYNNFVIVGPDKRNYSAPCQYIGKMADIIYTRSIVKIYVDGKLVATHSRSYNKRYVYEEDLMSVSELEQLTGLTFFPNVPNAPKAAYDPSDWNVTASNK